MKPIILLLALSVLAINTFCLQASSVWLAEKNGNKVFLGGTVHMLSEKDYPLPTAYMTAYNQSDELFFETDVALVKEDAIEAFKEFVVGRGLSIDMIDFNLLQFLIEQVIKENEASAKAVDAQIEKSAN